MTEPTDRRASDPTVLRRFLRRSWPALRMIVGLGAVGVGAWAISGKTGELSGITGYLNRLRWWWMVLAVVGEFASYAALSSLQRRLLRAGRVKIKAGTMLGITLAGSSIQSSFPGGTVFYLAYIFRQFRRRGADDVLSGWVLVAFNMLTFLALSVMALVGLAIAASTGSAYDLVEAILGIIAVALLMVIAFVKRRRVLAHFATLVSLGRRLIRRRKSSLTPQEVVDRWVAELSAVNPSRKQWSIAALMAASTWLADLACLVLAFYAVGVGVPWRGLLLAYAAGQLASNLPITPGGLGAVEGSLTVALVTFGGGEESTVAAVLLYRLVSYWLMLGIGWVAWARLAWSARARLPVATGSKAGLLHELTPAAAVDRHTARKEDASPWAP
ncbi:MAG: lysylphosphatidylglycerol synthase transmembrane domain-containing protein [Acidimicrobiales bacterium]